MKCYDYITVSLRKQYSDVSRFFFGGGGGGEGQTGTHIKLSKAAPWMASIGEIFKIHASRYSKNALPGSLYS